MEILLGFRPVDVSRLATSEIIVVLVNNSEFELAFSLMKGIGARGGLLCSDSVEATTELIMAREPVSQMQRWGEFTFQCILWKTQGEFPICDPIHVECRLDVGVFLKESSYRHPAYSEEPAFELALVKDGEPVRFNLLDGDAILNAMGAPDEKEMKRKMAADRANPRKGERRGVEMNPYKVMPPIEVDLHIHELVDTTAGMTNTDMLMLQLKAVRDTLKAHRKRIGQEITFIHGKGDGVLRKALLDLLRREYPFAEHRDANFRKYGFGATTVRIRQTK